MDGAEAAVRVGRKEGRKEGDGRMEEAKKIKKLNFVRHARQIERNMERVQYGLYVCMVCLCVGRCFSYLQPKRVERGFGL